jgi:hypothetical protein
MPKEFQEWDGFQSFIVPSAAPLYNHRNNLRSKLRIALSSGHFALDKGAIGWYISAFSCDNAELNAFGRSALWTST